MIDWKAAILSPDDNLSQAINVLNSESSRVVLVSDEKGRLLGTVTDGDIRRALIDHYGMEALLSDIMFKDPTTALASDNRRDILALMKDKDIEYVDLRFTDPRGKLQHLTRDGKMIDEEMLND